MTALTTTVFVGLGANLGQRAAQLAASLAELAAVRLDEVDPGQPVLIVDALSSVYESAPLGPVADQPKFYNMVACVRTSLPPLALLHCCLEVERRLGRTRSVAQGPRTIDIDLLLVDRLLLRTPQLTVPHAELTRRAFVLTPLLELRPELTDPRDGRPLRRHLDTVAAQQLVRVGSLARLAAGERVGHPRWPASCGAG